MTKEIQIATTDEVPEGTHKIVKAAGREIGLFNVRGNFHAVPNSCFHQNGPLCQGVTGGTLVSNEETSWRFQWAHEGEIIVCPWHSLEFNVVTGQCPAYPKKKLPTYQLRVDDGKIFWVLEGPA